MQPLTEKILRSNLPDVFTDVDLANLLLDATPDKRRALVKRALARGEIVRIRRGLYLLAEPFSKRPVSLFSLAMRIYPSSYISLESALSHHGWLPERVVTVTCGTHKRSASFDTPVGRFEFDHTPLRSLVAVERIQPGAGQAYLVATPLRALVDLVHVRTFLPEKPESLFESLRIPQESLDPIDHWAVDPLLESLTRSRARRFLEKLKKELQP